MAVIGIATPKSRGSALNVEKKLKVDFPNGLDLAGATYVLWDVFPTKSYGFVVDESGKIVYGYDLNYVMRGTKPVKLAFGVESEKYLKDAKDPFGIDEVPAECKRAYALLKVGRFEDARTIAKKLLRSSAAAATAEKIIAAADETEQKHFERMTALAEAGEAGELQEESKAFFIAFPRSKLKSKVKSLVSKAGRSGDGKNEATAAKNFDRALMYLQRKKAQGLMLMRAIGDKYEGTYYGDLAKTLGAKLK
ncbi:MAG: hypothetical protein ACYS9X_09640 [Planctomycetota bacterium]